MPQTAIPDRLAETWRIYLTQMRLGLELALPIQGILGLVYAPAAVILIFAVEAQWGQQGSIGSGDPAALRQMVAAYLPGDWPSVVGRSLSFAGGLLSVILLTVAFALILGSARDQRPGGRPAPATILRPASVFALPVAVAAVGGVVLNLLESAWMSSVPSSLDGSATVMTGPLIALDLLISVASILAIYAVSRWALAIPAAAVEELGLRKALARSSELSRGHRVHILLSLIVVSFATGFVTVGTAFAATLITGALLGTGSAAGFALSLLVFLAMLVLTAPLIPILIVVLYRDLRDGPEAPEADRLRAA